MSCVFQNIDPPPPSAPGECVVPPPLLRGGGRTHSPGGEGGRGSIFWKTQDTALYSTYIESSEYMDPDGTQIFKCGLHFYLN
jgi:hypothetical protein